KARAQIVVLPSVVANPIVTPRQICKPQFAIRIVLQEAKSDRLGFGKFISSLFETSLAAEDITSSIYDPGQAAPSLFTGFWVVQDRLQGSLPSAERIQRALRVPFDLHHV